MDDSSCSYLVADHHTSWWDYLFKNQGVSQSDTDDLRLHWRARTSLLLLRIVRSASQPLKHLGRWLERNINSFPANGGVFQTFLRQLRGQQVVFVDENSDTYTTFNGQMDPRTKLLLNAPSDIFFASPDSKLVADMCAMASKVAYESPAFLKSVVEKEWKMHFHGAYNCWNEFQEKNSTQAFIFSDQKDDAHFVVLAFRGTEAFNAYDWCTDFDFSWYQLPQLGRVHLGFLEALGLGDRKHMDTFQRLKMNIYENSRTPKSATPTSGLPSLVLETKLLAYDHISQELIAILRRNQGAKLYITGHSLGGALATVFSAMLFYYKKENRLFMYSREEEDVARRIAAVYTFGQPRVGDETFASFMDSSLNHPETRYFRMVHNSDIVARVPFDNLLFGFKHFGLCFFYRFNYTLQVLQEEPNPNYFAPMDFMLARIFGMLELVQSFFMSYRYGEEFRETRLSTVARIMGLLFPGVACHSLVNYINAIRLGPDHLLEANVCKSS